MGRGVGGASGTFLAKWPKTVSKSTFWGQNKDGGGEGGRDMGELIQWCDIRCHITFSQYSKRAKAKTKNICKYKHRKKKLKKLYTL